MTVGMFIPLGDYLTGWPENLFPRPDLDGLAVVAHETRITDGISTSVLELELSTDLILALPGVDIVTAELLAAEHGSGLTVEVDWTGPFRVRVLDLGADLLIDSPFLVPVSDVSGVWVPQESPVRIGFTAGSVELDGTGGLTFSSDVSLAVPPVRLGDTGFVVQVTGARPSFTGEEQPPPDTAVQGFRGLLFDRAALYFPDGLDCADIAPDSVEVVDGAIGTGGFSGVFTGTWATTWRDGVPSGDGAGNLLGFAFGLESLELQIQQDSVTGAALTGALAVPFFDQVLTVAVGIDAAGAFTATVTGTPDVPPAPEGGAPAAPTTPAIATLTIPGVARLRVDGLGLVRDDDGTALLVSGELDVLAGEPALTWPTITVADLRIAPDGRVGIPGGWLDLPQPLALNLYGFGMEITRIGFGTDDDGRRWVGVDGSVRLTELLPAGASARGLRVGWYPDDPGHAPDITLDGLAVDFAVPDAVSFGGEVALATDETTGAKLFTGDLRLGLDPLDIGIDAGITVGRADPNTYAFVHMGIGIPLPLGATGTALYGMEGLLAVNMAPLVADGPWPSPDAPQVRRRDWYGWYKQVPPEFSVTDPVKWAPEPGAWAIGAGVSLGTLPDAGFTVHTSALLVAILPGPVLLLQGTADLLSVPPALGGSDQEGTLGLLAALDGRAATLRLGIDAAWSLPEVLSIAAATEAFFDFDRPDAWHLWIGRDTPPSARIRADILALFHADAWLMLGHDGIDTGLSVAWGDQWQYGPVRIAVDSWIGAAATLTRRPAQLAGNLHLGGTASVDVGPFGLGVGVRARLSGSSPSPYEVSGTLSVSVDLPPPLKDLDVDIGLTWRQPAVPTVEDPWDSAVLQHPLRTDSWTPVDGGSVTDAPDDDAPLVPLDAGLLLTFGQPMGDLTPVSDNPPATAPTTVIGDHVADYALTALRLSRRRRYEPDTGWQDVTDTLFGTWTPDAGDAGSRLQLMSRNPFAFTRFGSRRWVDGFLATDPEWPCRPEPPLDLVCLTWNDSPVGTVLSGLWEQDDAVLSTDGRLAVVDGPAASRVLRLGLAEVDGQTVDGRLWVTLPEPAVVVTAPVNMHGGPSLQLRGWTEGIVAAEDVLTKDVGVLSVAGQALDAVTVEWGQWLEAEIAALCWIPASASAARASWADRASRLATAAQRWSDAQPLFEPDCHYLLEVTSRARLTDEDGTSVQEVEQTHAVQFRTGGPPTDLAPYVLRTVPDPAAAPAFRAYDLGCTFGTSYVPQFYGGDLSVRVVGDDGTDIAMDCALGQAPTTTVTGPDAPWLARLAACTGLPQPIRGDATLQAGLPSGVTLPAHRALTARLETTRPLFTDPSPDLATFDQQALSGRSDTVVALGGDPDTVGCTVACTAKPRGDGTFGLVVGYGGPDSWLALELTVGGGRRLVSVTPAGRLAAERVLWQDNGAVHRNVTYGLSITAAAGAITIAIDDLDVTVPGTTGAGRFGLLFGPDGCDFGDLLVRSAPSAAVHSWRFTTSAYAGLPELLDGFAGRTWPATAGVDRAALAVVDTTRLAAAEADVTTARADLAAADVVDQQTFVTDALDAVARQHTVADDVYRALSGALGLGYRPAPPLVELLTVTAGTDTVAVLVDLPEPLPWERMSWSLTPVGPHPTRPLDDAVLAWSADGAHAVIVRSAGRPLPTGTWSLRLTLALDVGTERAVWTRGNSSAPETSTVRFTLD
ncbi:MAG TPA: hypothetical protein VFW65_36870 [Pseudonocardiaceae bacterium]|nr:hypothetical protein [Pseudonocardiaceae bacterium]